MAGYSGTPLPQKLGIKPGHHIALLGAPDGFGLGNLPADVRLSTSLTDRTPFDVLVFFVDNQAQLERRFPTLAKRITPSGGLWISWPKKSSGVATDLTEDTIRPVGLKHGLVDNKVCAVNDVWSGLRFVWRLENRPPQ